MFRVVIAGTRFFNDYNLLKKTMDMVLGNRKDVIIISGTAIGADKLGERYALEKNFLVHRFFPEDNSSNAKFKRNVDMAESADMVVVFWNGESTGSKHMINEAIKRKLLTYVIKYKSKEVEKYENGKRNNLEGS